MQARSARQGVCRRRTHAGSGGIHCHPGSLIFHSAHRSAPADRMWCRGTPKSPGSAVAGAHRASCVISSWPRPNDKSSSSDTCAALLVHPAQQHAMSKRSSNTDMHTTQRCYPSLLHPTPTACDIFGCRYCGQRVLVVTASPRCLHCR
jgi:hypothetical protein